MGHKPVVVDAVEAGVNIAFEYPLSGVLPRQCFETLFDCICA
jgi:hypothetical protein